MHRIPNEIKKPIDESIAIVMRFVRSGLQGQLGSRCLFDEEGNDDDDEDNDDDDDDGDTDDVKHENRKRFREGAISVKNRALKMSSEFLVIPENSTMIKPSLNTRFGRATVHSSTILSLVALSCVKDGTMCKIVELEGEEEEEETDRPTDRATNERKQACKRASLLVILHVRRAL